MAVVLDQFGRPVETPRRPDERQIAVASVADRWTSYPSRGLTPERLAAILREADDGDVCRQSELFQEFEEKDAHLAAVLQTRKNAVIGLPRSVQPFDSEDPECVKDAELVTELLDQLDQEDLILDLMDAVGKGFSVCEILWQTGERALPARVEWVPQQRFTWDGSAVRLLTDGAPVAGEQIPANKFVIHRYKARSGSAARAGMLRVVSWMYLFKNYAVKDWVQYAEVFGMPLRLGKYEPGTSKEDIDKLLRTVVAIAANAAGVIPSNASIEFPAAGSATKGSAADVFPALIEYCDRAISKAVLGQTLTTDAQSGSGTLAGSAHNEVRRDLLEADAAAIAKTIQRDIIRPIVGFNRGWERTKRLPYLDIDTSEPEDQERTARTYGILVKDVGLRIGAGHVRERFGIPAPDADEELVGSASAAPAPPTGAAALKAGRPAGAVAHSAQIPPEQAQVAGLEDASIAEAAPAADGMTAAIERIVEAATDYDDLRDRVLAAYADLDVSELSDVLARATFMAEMAGRAHA
ncbi:MAG: DUF935 domain-containing protein [Deltaproteobacteria bacterium]|nr:DUF935 domain-containing protein [Deltaproteobacteria bacterium]